MHNLVQSCAMSNTWNADKCNSNTASTINTIRSTLYYKHETQRILLKSSQIWAFPRFFLLRNLLSFENYLEYFSSVWSDKKYFIQIKRWERLYGLKAAHIHMPNAWKCFKCEMVLSCKRQILTKIPKLWYWGEV